MAVAERRADRSDARPKATGAALYTQDFQPRGMLHGAIVRSPHAAALLSSLDLEAARAVPGVRVALTAADLPPRRYGIIQADEPVLAVDRVRYVGEPVALIAAESRAAAAEAVRLARVSYEPLDAAVELDDALAAGAPRVDPESENDYHRGTIRRGDVEAAFAAAAEVVETEIRSHRAHQAYLEPRVALARFEAGRLSVLTTSQSPYEVREGLGRLFDLPLSAVRVKVPALGGGFGGKLHLGMAPYAAALAIATERPVQVLCSRAEEMQSPAPRENSVVRLASAVDGEGRILARRAEILLDSGAYAYDTPALVATASLQACGTYEIPAVAIDGACVATNSVPTGSFRAPTGPQMAFANELHVADIAARLELSPQEVRRRNVVRDGGHGPSGQVLEDPAMSECLARAEARLEEWRADPADGAGGLRGFGLASAWWNTFPGGSAATVMMVEDGGVVVRTGATEIGTGAVQTGIATLVAEVLGIEADEVRLEAGDTDGAPFDFGSQGSRTLQAAGGAAARAAAAVRRQLVDRVAEELEISPQDLVVEAGRVHAAGDSAAGMSLGEAVAKVAATDGPVAATRSFKATAPAAEPGAVEGLPFETFNDPTFHCHAVELEVAPETGQVTVLRYLAVHDIGPAINPSGVIGQIEGGVVQGIGYALYEEIKSDADGRTANAGFVDYRLPTIADVPHEIEVDLVVDHPGEGGPHGAKGIGEAPIILPPAALAAAIGDALGRQPRRLPLDATYLRELALEGALV